jgi:hypothetical protein
VNDDPLDLLRRVVQSCEEVEVGYAIIGAVARNAWAPGGREEVACNRCGRFDDATSTRSSSRGWRQELPSLDSMWLVNARLWFALPAERKRIWQQRRDARGTMMKRLRSPVWWPAVVAILLRGGAVAEATMLIEALELPKMAESAGRVVHGTVTAVDSGRDERGLPATWVTIRVAETFKGAHSSEFTFKQFGVLEPLEDGTATRIVDLPGYRSGDELVLFLYGESTLGFTSPVGLSQGMFRVERFGGGARAQGARAPAANLDAFLNEIRRLLAK